MVCSRRVAGLVAGCLVSSAVGQVHDLGTVLANITELSMFYDLIQVRPWTSSLKAPMRTR